jgi:hypothetical protein
MIKPLSMLIMCASVFVANAQTNSPGITGTMPFGKIDIADLQMKACDFEKDANAEVLFEKGDSYFDQDFNVITNEVHKRIKIFNDNGKNEADIHISYQGGNQYEFITGVQAETINLVDGKIEITKLDKKLIYDKIIDKRWNEIAFTFPNVKPGSVIEYKYKWNTNVFYHMPTWFFQDKIPSRYNEFSTQIPDVFYFRVQPQFYQPLIKHVNSTDSRTYGSGSDSHTYNLDNELRAMANIHSLPEEPYMSSFADNVQCIIFQLVSIKPIYGFIKSFSDSWAKVGGILADDEDFGAQLKRRLADEDNLVARAKALKSDDERIAFLFNEVKNTMKWNENDDWYTIDGTSKAWDKKTGNATEINLILYHLLKQSGVDAYPMVVSTREHGKVRPYYTSLAQFNRAVVYIPVDSTKKYVLDASGKYNMYNQTPAEILNSSGLYIDKAKKLFDIIEVENDLPARQIVLVSGEIKPNGKLEGTAQINSTSYNKTNTVTRYKTDGEKKYMDYLQDGDNNLKIASVAFENMDVDSLPLTQKIAFNLDLAGSDENYIYLNANLFSSLKINPFLSENRMTDIDFGYLKNYSINGTFKIPAGYKIDALPKSVSMVMPDKSISFKRIVGEADGSFVVRYSISYNKVLYSKNDYEYFHDFFKKMYEMLNEQVVLKKI